MTAFSAEITIQPDLAESPKEGRMEKLDVLPKNA